QSGTPFWNQLSISPLRDRDGQITHFISFQRDISQAENSRQQWYLSQSRLALLATLYQALADTRQIFRDQELVAPASVFGQWCQRLVKLLALRLAFVGVVNPGTSFVHIIAAAGPARSYVDGLVLSADADRPEGQGPAGQALRKLGAVLANVTEPSFAPWRSRAIAFQLESNLTAAARCTDGTRLLLSVYRDPAHPFAPDLETLFHQLVQEAADFMDRQRTVKLVQRLEQYREAHRDLQTRLLTAATADEIYTRLIDTLVHYTDAEGVDVLVPSPDHTRLQRVRVGGALAAAMLRLPTPPLAVLPQDQTVPLPTRVWQEKTPIIIRHPHQDPMMPTPWHHPPLSRLGVVGGWPIVRAGAPEPWGVVTIAAEDPETFTPELSELIGEILQSTGIALGQHEDRRQIQRLHHYQRAAVKAQHEFLQLPSPEALYTRLVNLLVQETDGAGAYIVTNSPGLDSLHLTAVAAKTPALKAALARLKPSKDPQAPEGQLLCARAWRERREIGPINPLDDPALRDWLRHDDDLSRLGGIVAWPIFCTRRTEPEAVLAILSYQVSDFTPELMQLLTLLVESLRVALNQLRTRDEMAQLAWRDPLTGLPNRRALDTELEQRLDEAGRRQSAMAVCLLDLDDFKPVNDRWGHAAGDRVLQELAHRLQDHLRTSDFVARLGGDEFIILLDRVSDPDIAARIVESLASAIQEPILLPGLPPLTVHASMGLAFYPDNGTRPQDLLRQADQALYADKAQKSRRHESLRPPFDI
ncbi:MAG: diguanylate cyclase, partial [Sulfobacillus sp.]|nr:diguanylate cyclase [Sulfobacillus sp.]